MKEFQKPELIVKKTMLKDIITASTETPTTPTKKPDIEMPEIGFDD